MEKIRTWDPLAYVIVFEKDDGERRYHGSELQSGQAALRCYPSPFNALLDISRNPASVVESGQSISIYPDLCFPNGKDNYGAGGLHQYEKLVRAASLDFEVALRACSWGGISDSWAILFIMWSFNGI